MRKRSQACEDWEDEMELRCWQGARPTQSLKEGQRAECGWGMGRVAKMGPARAGLSRPG